MCPSLAGLVSLSALPDSLKENLPANLQNLKLKLEEQAAAVSEFLGRASPASHRKQPLKTSPDKS